LTWAPGTGGITTTNGGVSWLAMPPGIAANGW